MRTLFLAAAFTLTACNSEPQPQPKTIDEINQIVRIADTAIAVVQKIGTGAPTTDVQGAMEEMSAALDAARNQIHEVTHRVGIGKYLGRGSIDPINVSACIDQYTISAPPIEQIPVTLLPISMCAISANTYFGAVSGDDGSAVALAVGIIYPVALVANANAAGLKGGGVWLQQYRSVNEAIVARLAPKCRPHSAGTEQVRYDCAAYEVAMSVRPKLEALADQVPTSP